MDKLMFSDPRETMVLTPHLLGFRPRNKIVLVALSMESIGGTGPILQCKLADFADYADLSYIAMQLVLDYKLTGLAIDWYGDDLAEMCDDLGLIHHIDAAARQVQAYMSQRYQLTGHGRVCAGITDYCGAINVAEFTALTDQQFSAAQESGIVAAYQELTERPMNAELVYQGSAPLDCEPVAPEMRVPLAIRNDAIIAYYQCAGGKEFRPKALWKNALLKLAAGAEVADLALASDAAKIGRLNAALKDIELRDSLIIYAINPQIKTSDIFDYATSAAQLETAQYTPVSQQRVAKMMAILELLASYSADDDPSAYGALAYLLWWTGESEQAAKYVAQALRSDPRYSLAQLVKRAVSTQLPPPWLENEAEASRLA